MTLRFENTGSAAAVFHVYDRLHLDRLPRRYTVEPNKQLTDTWASSLSDGRYDLWVLGPNGFHRHFAGASGEAAQPEARVLYDELHGGIYFKLRNPTASTVQLVLTPNAYFARRPLTFALQPEHEQGHYVPLDRTGHWYDFSVTLADDPSFFRRFAGRVETGHPSWSDPALGGTAIGEQLVLGDRAKQ